MTPQEFAERYLGDPPETIRISASTIEVAVADEIPPLRITKASIASLERKKFPRVSKLKLIPHCGWSWHSYYEFLINIDGLAEWSPEGPLRFRIGQVSVEAGHVTPAFVLLMEPVYRNKTFYQDDFAYYSSVRLYNVADNEAGPYLNNALFYLNSDYLAPAHSTVSLHHLLTGTEPFFRFPSDSDRLLARKRVRNRPFIATEEPVKLFNQAASDGGVGRFLGYYRVLEFYFERAVLEEVRKSRFDKNGSDEDLVRSARITRERPMLEKLIGRVLTTAEQAVLTGQAAKRNYAARDTLASLSDAFYGFRNSLVHAKESEIARAQIPDPMNDNPELQFWNEVVELTARAAIKRLGMRSAV